jgi:hypothetical protein
MSERLKTLAFTVAGVVIGVLIAEYLKKKMCKDCKTAQVGLTASGTSIPKTAAPTPTAPTPTAVPPTVTTTSGTAAARMLRG